MSEKLFCFFVFAKDTKKREYKTKVLKKLMTKAEHTAFGEHFHFTKLLQQKNPIEGLTNRFDKKKTKTILGAVFILLSFYFFFAFQLCRTACPANFHC